MPDPLPFQFAQKVNSVKDIELPRYVKDMASIGPSMRSISSPSLRTCAGASLMIRSICGAPTATNDSHLQRDLAPSFWTGVQPPVFNPASAPREATNDQQGR